MRRVATNKIKLADGIEIPKGTAVMVSTHGMWDDSIYPEADKFDGYRFFNLRQTPGQENSSQLVTTSPDHLGFGHGQHACPGRFFAANEAKIALCHILLKYDIKAVNENEPIKIGINMMSNPKGKVAIRRRDEEIAL